jgi:hypothetical protein
LNNHSTTIQQQGYPQRDTPTFNNHSTTRVSTKRHANTSLDPPEINAFTGFPTAHGKKYRAMAYFCFEFKLTNDRGKLRGLFGFNQNV